MNDMKKANRFLLFIMIANIIIITVGATFAYFGVVTNSEDNTIALEAMVFEIGLEEDTSLIKTNVIPSKELYVDYGTIKRVDENNKFIKPYEENGELITKETVCIDDNLNEICSVYTFTVTNPMTDMELPIYATINPVANTFSNLYFKVLDEDKNIIMEKTPMKQTTQTDSEENSAKTPIALKNLGILPKATIDPTTGETIPGRKTYSIVMWILETNKNQTELDSGKVFAASLNVITSGDDGRGMTGVFTIGGTE